MDPVNDSNVAVLAIIDGAYSSTSTVTYKPNLNISYTVQNVATIPSEPEAEGSNVKQNKIWTKSATLTLLSLYEAKIHMLDNPKKKSKMWISIANELRAFNVDVSSDQVRWKINALTKKYKDCLDNGKGSEEFKYFNEMQQILGNDSDDAGVYRLASEVQTNTDKMKNKKQAQKMPFRQLRAERRAKVELDKQWMEYLKNQDEQKQIREERVEKQLMIKEEELKLRQKELDIKKTIAYKKLELKQRKHEDRLRIEKEKCELLRILLEKQETVKK